MKILCSILDYLIITLCVIFVPIIIKNYPPDIHPLAEITINKSPQTIIRQMALSRGWNISDTNILIKIAECESQFGKFKYHTNNDGTIDRGLFMFNDYFHPQITDECAQDVYCATNEAINLANRQGFYPWACYNLIE